MRFQIFAHVAADAAAAGDEFGQQAERAVVSKGSTTVGFREEGEVAVLAGEFAGQNRGNAGGTVTELGGQGALVGKQVVEEPVVFDEFPSEGVDEHEQTQAAVPCGSRSMVGCVDIAIPLRRATAAEHGAEGFEQDSDVGPERPRVDVGEVHLDPFAE